MSCVSACPTCHALRRATLAAVGRGAAAPLSDEALAAAAGLTPSEAARHYPSADACLRAASEEVSDRLEADLRSCFLPGVSWSSAMVRARRKLLERLAAHPAEARLCFVETLGGDRELRRARDHRRRCVVDFLTEQSARSRRGERLSRIQIELLIGAIFHEISAAVAAGEVATLPTLEPRLTELSGLFDPTSFGGVPRRASPIRRGASLRHIAAHPG
jgi:AcrR family transcriptional regulator